MKYLIIAVIIYLLIGIVRIWTDFRQPRINQPIYVKERNVRLIIIYVVTWPLVIYFDLDHYVRKVLARIKKS